MIANSTHGMVDAEYMYSLRAANRESVKPGENIWVNTDVLMTHDVCGPGTIGIFKREFGKDAKVRGENPVEKV